VDRWGKIFISWPAVIRRHCLQNLNRAGRGVIVWTTQRCGCVRKRTAWGRGGLRKTLHGQTKMLPDIFGPGRWLGVMRFITADGTT